MVTVVPSRSRPHNIPPLLEAWHATTSPDMALVVRVDEDDPCLSDYLTVDPMVVIGPPLRFLAPTLTSVALTLVHNYDAVGFIGDDCRPRTHHWDRHLAAALDAMGSGIVYPEDGIHHGGLPCHVWITSDIISTLGWFAPPKMRHLFIDNAWQEIGRAINRLKYVPEVLVEHLHPIAGKAEWDDLYRAVNAGDQYALGDRLFSEYLRDDFAGDVKKLRAMLAAKGAH